MSVFLRDVFGAEEIYDSGEKTFSLAREKFFRIGGVWVAIMEGEGNLPRSYNHVAFKISPEDFDLTRERLLKLGIELRESPPPAFPARGNPSISTTKTTTCSSSIPGHWRNGGRGMGWPRVWTGSDGPLSELQNAPERP